MGNLDVPKVIQAAASSNLGVLSLLVLVLAFLAWRFFQRSNDRVKLAAFGLIFLGAIGFGASIFLASGNQEAAARPASASTATPAPPDPTAASGPVPGTSSAAEPAQEPPASQAADLSGEWHGDDGYRFRFTQQGERIRYEALHNGKAAGSGDGALQGRALRYRFTDVESGDQGSCEARLSDDGRVIEGHCRSDGGGAAWDMRIER